MGQLDGLKPFQPGADPRRNTKGRPKTFKQLRALAIQIADEPVKDGDTVTRIEKMLREMAKSDNPSDRALLLKYAFGNVPDEAEVKAKVTLVVKYADKDADDKPA
jgi:hypothetical protein